MVLARVMVSAHVMVLSCFIVLTYVMVLFRVMVLSCVMVLAGIVGLVCVMVFACVMSPLRVNSRQRPWTGPKALDHLVGQMMDWFQLIAQV